MCDKQTEDTGPKKFKSKQVKSLMDPNDYQLMLAQRRESERARRKKNPEYFREKQKKCRQKTKDKKREMEVIEKLFKHIVVELYKKDVSPTDLINELETKYETSLGKKLIDSLSHELNKKSITLMSDVSVQTSF